MVMVAWCKARKLSPTTVTHAAVGLATHGGYTIVASPPPTLLCLWSRCTCPASPSVYPISRLYRLRHPSLASIPALALLGFLSESRNGLTLRGTEGLVVGVPCTSGLLSEKQPEGTQGTGRRPDELAIINLEEIDRRLPTVHYHI